MQLQVIN